MGNKPVFMNPEGAGIPLAAYSQVSKVDSGPLYFIAGQLAVGENGSIVGIGDFEVQYYQAFKNLKKVLDGLGITHNNIAQLNVYLVEQEHVELFDKLCKEYFPTIFEEGFPPKTLLVVKSLARKEFLIELDAVAAANK